ncbi:MAG: hypothetical protein C0522_12850 [Rhodocyclaceae bacterium]|nr:hypothetical protein [Rhodocyclaceae bacterium]
MQHYEKVDEMYSALLSDSLGKPHLAAPEKCTTEDQRIEYETYAFMVWNFIETVYDRCRDDDDLMATWLPIIEHEAGKHHAWLCCPRNQARFKAPFLNYIWDRFRIAPYYHERAKESDLPEIAELQRRYYGKDAIPLSTYTDWFRANPNGFHVIRSRNLKGQMVGQITFIGFEAKKFSTYLDGAITEHALAGDDVVSQADLGEASAIYLESIMIKEDFRRSLRPYLGAIMLSIVEGLRIRRLENIYAMAATADGERFLRNEGFVGLDSPTGNRADGHLMFRADFAEFRQRQMDAALRYRR